MSDRSGNRVWRLNAYPQGEDFAAAITLERAAVPEPAPGEVVIRNEWLSLDAGTRMWMTPRTDSYQPPIPLGSVVPGLALGRVHASRAEGFAAGQLVRGFGQWADYSAVVPALAGLTVLDETLGDPRDHFGVFGMNAWTAYAGLVEAGRARPGETILVSAAAGATGMFAAQIGRIMGCKVLAMAGGSDKCRFLTERIGVDAAIDYKAGGVSAAIAAAAPEGVGVYFDNVGGPLLDEVLPVMAHYGRIAVCGMVASYGGAPTVPQRFDQVLARRLQITGFFIPDFLDRAGEFNAILKSWVAQGRIRSWFDESEGLENVLTAYAKLFTGGNTGKVIVKVR